MNTYKVIINNTQYLTNVKLKTTDNAIIRYTKMYLRKTLKIDLNLIFEHQLIEKCPFCGAFSSYVLDYEINHDLMTVYYHGVKLRTSNGMIDYHCHQGRKCKGSLLNPNSIEYVSTSFKITEDAALEFIHRRNNTPFYKENHKSTIEYKNFQAHDLNWFIDKYGNHDGTRRFDNMCRECSIKNTNKYILETYGEEVLAEIEKKKAVGSILWWITRYGEIEGKEKYDKWIKSVKITKENFIKRHGEHDGGIKWDSFIEKKKMLYSLNGFISKHGVVHGTFLWGIFLKKSSFSREQYITKYGLEKYIESKKNNKRFFSMESVNAFNVLLDKLCHNNIEICNLKWREDEFFIYDRQYKKIYFYDMYFMIKDRQYIIEYDTPFMHPNIDYMTSEELTMWKNPFNVEQTYLDKIEFDKRKINLAKEHNIDIVTFYIRNSEDLYTNINNFIDYVNNR